MYPSQSRPITLPIDISTSGDNEIISNPHANNQLVFIKQLMLLPEDAVRITMKAVDDTSGAERFFTSDMSFVAGQGFIQESFDAQFPFIFELRKGENFVIELDGAVDCKGYLNYSIYNQQ